MRLRGTVGVGVALTMVAAFSAAVPAGASPATAGRAPADEATGDAARAAFLSMPPRFEANQGQADPSVRFLARAGGQTLFLTDSGAVLSLRKDGGPATAVRLGLAGADPRATVSGTERLPGVTNYLIGNDRSRWLTGIASFAGVRYRGVYPGIDLVWHSAGGGGLEYDFEVAPGADPGRIALVTEGTSRPTVDGRGALVLRTGAGVLRQSRPVVYQGSGAGRRPVQGRFRVDGDTVGVALGRYDRSKPLVIDPVLVYSSYLGASTPLGVAADGAGNAYVTGNAQPTGFPTTAGVVQPADGGGADAFVAKVDTTASGAASLVWATYLGGSGTENVADNAAGIAVDGAGDPFVTGTTSSANFPTTAGSFDTACGTAVGGTCNATDSAYSDGSSSLNSTTYTSATAKFDYTDIGLPITGANIPANTTIAGAPSSTTVTLSAAATANGSNLAFTIGRRDPLLDGFVAKLSPNGASLAYSTYVGGSNVDEPRRLALGPTGLVYVAGFTRSSDLPTSGSVAAYQPACGTNGTCNALNYTNTDGATTSGSTTFTSLNATFTGAFVGRTISGVNIPAGTTIASVASRAKVVLSNAATATGTAIGYTVAAAKPHPNAFLAQFDTAQAGAAGLRYATFLSGSGAAANDNSGDRALGLAVDASGNAYLAGETFSTNFPVAGGYQTTSQGGSDAFVARLNPAVGGAGGLVYATYLGGTNVDNATSVAVDGSNHAFIVGNAIRNTGFPVTTAALGTPTTNCFLAKLDTAAAGAASLS